MLPYAGFWRRTLALIVDGLSFGPIIALHIAFGYTSREVLATDTVVFALFAIAFPVFFLSRWGQTPGKMLAGIKVTRRDGSPIGAREAWLRSSVDIALTVLTAAATVSILASWNGPDWATLSRRELLATLTRRDPLQKADDLAMNLWYWGELVVLLCNRERRALHDYLAGTVVLRATRARAPGRTIAGASPSQAGSVTSR